MEKKLVVVGIAGLVVALGVRLMVSPADGQRLLAKIRDQRSGGSLYREAWVQPTRGLLTWNRLIGAMLVIMGLFTIVGSLAG